jgi:uncharacterized protein (DUF1697 family)
LKYVALLRGINVGKSVQVPMKTLKNILEKMDLNNIITYLNSGNVIFESELNASELTCIIEDELEQSFGKRIKTLIKTEKEMHNIVKDIPKEWSSDEKEQTYVAYLFNNIDKPDIIAELPIKREYMKIIYTPGAIVWNIKRENYNRSQITRIAEHKNYSLMTTRNVNTARKLAELSR